MWAVLGLKGGVDLFHGKSLEDIKKGWHGLADNWGMPFLICEEMRAVSTEASPVKRPSYILGQKW